MKSESGYLDQRDRALEKLEKDEKAARAQRMIDFFRFGGGVETDIDKLRSISARLANALSFVGQRCCKYRAERKCLIDCQGAVICDTTDLVLVDENGKAVGGKNA